MSDKFNARAAIAIGITVLCWASAFVSIRDAGRHLDPGPLTLGRAGVAAVVLLAVWAIRREGLPKRAAWPGILTAGILWFGLYMVALNWGEQLVDAGTAALIVNIGPILIALLGGWLLKEGFPPRLFLGMAVSFAGVAVVSLSMSRDGAASVLGVLLCLVSAITYAISVVVQKPTLKHCTSLQFTAFGNAIAAVLCLPFAPLLFSELEAAPSSATLHVLYLGLFPTALAFLTWGYALRFTTAGKLGATTYVVPAIVVGLSWILLDEIPTWLTLAGGALALVGVAISRSRGRKQSNDAPKPPVEATDAAAPAVKS
ncbi:drug/metabolite transporter (DMT)-like permease [Glycomyces algeriensis]|uniref:Membrane protein n=1 Tax=Glycomyces algeriensis TaxID=256037 RepID=A0A9W6G9P9_9ACTN|nr:DMT family transporter [Glycomyces algeriensis]MDA1364826.1 DMT family transporter [Glycomyces algeriensis]MDR7350115.1 drug/metabolite transporter (DMT)-like permease [Glycomyces algeriensis]GLI42828.1 membrane protein [Glycomyces algeriensis]